MQRSFDDLGRPLIDVTFVVLDLETTGGSPATDAITEVGALKLRGGECLGTFGTLVNPGRGIPPAITYLTGITEAMVRPAPPIEEVLPALLEFVGDAVVVGHNVGFDIRFLDAALGRSGRPRLGAPVVDTCALARRLVREEVPDCKLGTLASRLRLDHRPSHRALDDALATADLLHALLERAAGLGVTGLDDLLALPTARGHAQLGKLGLTADLPRAPGVYLFRDGAGRVLYVGKATDLRRRVRSYFGAASSGDDRRKLGPLLRELASIDHVVCSHELEARVLEIRLIHQLDPRYNKEARHWRRYVYLKLTLAERFPRLAVVRATPADGSLYLGPIASARSAQLVAEAIESVVGLRRCRGPVPRRPLPGGPCTPAQLGVASCPCAGGVDEEDYARLVGVVVRGLTDEPATLLQPLEQRMRALAAAERFEDAAATRDRLAALARVLDRQRRADALRRAGEVVVEVPGEGGARLLHGRLTGAWGPRHGGAPLPLSVAAATAGLAAAGAGAAPGREAPESPDDPDDPDGPASPDGPLRREAVDEVLCVLRWIEHRAPRLRVLRADAGLAWPVTRVAEPAVGRAS